MSDKMIEIGGYGEGENHVSGYLIRSDAVIEVNDKKYVEWDEVLNLIEAAEVADY